MLLPFNSLSQAPPPLHHPLLSRCLPACAIPDVPNQKCASLTPLARFWSWERSSQIPEAEVGSWWQKFPHQAASSSSPCLHADIVPVDSGGSVGLRASVLAPSAVVAGQVRGMTDTGGTWGVQLWGPLATALPWVFCLEAVQDAAFSLIQLSNAFLLFFFYLLFSFYFFSFHRGLWWLSASAIYTSRQTFPLVLDPILAQPSSFLWGYPHLVCFVIKQTHLHSGFTFRAGTYLSCSIFLLDV